MNRRSVLIGSVAALIAPLLPARVQAKLLDKPVPPLWTRGVAPQRPAVHPLWAKDCLRWRGQVLTGERAHWCWDWDGLPVDETTPEFASCTCEWEHPDPDTTYKFAPRKLI